MELEKRVASALKPECGESFTTLTELMFGSTCESEALTETFRAMVPKKNTITSFSFKVLE